MKQLVLTISFLLIAMLGFGQCDIPILSTQSDIDNFPINYPGCSDVYNLRITGPGISDLSPLSQITSVQQQFYIVECNLLQDLTGLDNISYAGSGLGITDNASLTSLSGLGGLSTINGSLYIGENQNLTNLQGLNSLNEIVADNLGEGGLGISLNNSMVNLSGLENLSSVHGSITIGNNALLENLDALLNISSVNDRLQISENSSLNSLSGLSNLQSIMGGLYIYGNNSLPTLEGLESLNSFDGNISIHNNVLLSSIEALNNITLVNNIIDVFIVNNPQLSECDIVPICEIINDPSVGFNIMNNNVGCNNKAEIQIECGIVNIPDTNFLNALLEHTPVIDTNNDDLIQFDEAEAFTGVLNVANKTIFDFTGMEAFVNISGFNGSGNFMGGLSLKNNALLTSVDFSDSPDLEAVNLKNGNNTAITSFNGTLCPSLQFICVDNVAFAETNFTNIDAQVQFVEDCEFLSTPSFNLEAAITVFPNPVSETLNISVPSTFNYTKAELYSVSGQKLKETSATQINMSDLSAGIYFIQIISEVGYVTKKIVKQ